MRTALLLLLTLAIMAVTFVLGFTVNDLWFVCWPPCGLLIGLALTPRDRW